MFPKQSKISLGLPGFGLEDALARVAKILSDIYTVQDESTTHNFYRFLNISGRFEEWIQRLIINTSSDQNDDDDDGDNKHDNNEKFVIIDDNWNWSLSKILNNALKINIINKDLNSLTKKFQQNWFTFTHSLLGPAGINSQILITAENNDDDFISVNFKEICLEELDSDELNSWCFLQVQELSQFKKALGNKISWDYLKGKNASLMLDELESDLDGLYEGTKGMKIITHPIFDETDSMVWFPKLDPIFCGRKDELFLVENSLNNENGKNSCLLYGMGGIGKSSIALEYVQQHESDYDYIFFIDANHQEDSCKNALQMIVNQYCFNKPYGYTELTHYQTGIEFLLSVKLNDSFKIKTISAETASLALLSWTEKQHHIKCLFVVENVDWNQESHSNLCISLTKNHDQHVLFTSKSMNIPENLDTTMIKIIEVDEKTGIKILFERSDRIIPFKDDDIELISAKNIVNQVKGCPLVLQLIGIEIQKDAIAFSDYYKKLKKNFYKELNQLSLHLTLLGFNLSTISQIFNYSFDDVDEIDPITKLFLNICGYLDKDNIPIDLFEKSQDMFTSKDLKKIITTLKNDSMIQLSKNNEEKKEFSFHPLIHYSIKSSLEISQSAITTVLQFWISVLSNINHDNDQDWVFCKKICKHIIESETILLPRLFQSPISSNLLNSIAICYTTNHNYHLKAEKLFKSILNQQKKELGKDSLETITTLHNIGVFYKSQGKFGEALDTFDTVLGFRKRKLGLENLDTLSTLFEIAQVFDSQEQYEKSLNYYRDVLTLQEKVVGIDNIDCQNTIRKIGGVLLGQEKYDEALKTLNSVYSWQLNHFGSEDLHTMKVKHDIARVLDGQGKHKEAIRIYNEVLEFQKKNLSINHPDTISTMHNLALAYDNEDEYEQALSIYTEVLDLEETNLGSENPDTMNTLYNIGILHDNNEVYDKALEVYSNVLELRKKALGMHHPDTRTTMNLIASVHDTLEEYDKAFSMYSEVFNWEEANFGLRDPNTLETMNQLAQVLDHKGEDDKALLWYDKVLDLQERNLGLEHPETMNTIYNIASILDGAGRYAQALEMYLRVLVWESLKYGANHPDTLVTSYNIAQVYQHLDRFDDAIDAYESVLESQITLYGKDDLRSVKTVNQLAKLYEKKQDYNKSIDLFQTVLDSQVQKLPSCDPEILSTLKKLAHLYNYQNEDNKAIECYRQIYEMEKNKFGFIGINTLTTYFSIGKMLDLQLNRTEAIKIDEKILETYQKTNNLPTDFRVEVMEHMGHMLEKEKKPRQALKQFKQVCTLYKDKLDLEYDENLSAKLMRSYKHVLKVQRRDLGFLDLESFTTMNEIAELYKRQGNFRKAVKWYKELYNLQKKSLGMEHPLTFITEQSIKDSSRKCSRFDNISTISSAAI